MEEKRENRYINIGILTYISYLCMAVVTYLLIDSHMRLSWMETNHSHTLEKLDLLERRCQPPRSSFSAQGVPWSYPHRNRNMKNSEKLGTPRNGSLSEVVYTRWGKAGCGETTHYIMAGYAVSVVIQTTALTGGGGLVCISTDMSKSVNGSGWQKGPIMAAVRFHLRGVIPVVRGVVSQHWSQLDNQAMECAMCSAPFKSLITFYGKNECPSIAWKKIYHGYAMSPYYSNDSYMYFKEPTSPICVDKEPNRAHQRIEFGLSAEYGFVKLYAGPPFSTPHESSNSILVECVVCGKRHE